MKIEIANIFFCDYFFLKDNLKIEQQMIKINLFEHCSVHYYSLLVVLCLLLRWK